ncbi:MAG: DUF1684 domain-containing protein [Anaerolineales bacterium]|nr:DUF1684 domain-containing protein [Anaerolineales bacterium]
MTDYEETIKNIRTARNKKTASDPLHWLNLAGLFWLEEGENPFGSDEANKIVLPAFPQANCGSLRLKDGLVTLQPAEDTNITINGVPPASRPLLTDREKEPDLINLGSLTMKIIIRGGAPLVRIWDRESYAGKDFTGFHYYPAKPEYRITAKYVRYDPPKLIKVMEVIGTEIDSALLGQAQFTLNGVDCTLEAEKSGDGLLFNFTDGTNKDTTYGGGRKFYLPKPEGDEIILDFNLTENWPCAYTPYATCPIPSKENRLPIKVEAGELKYHD